MRVGMQLRPLDARVLLQLLAARLAGPVLRTLLGRPRRRRLSLLAPAEADEAEVELQPGVRRESFSLPVSRPRGRLLLHFVTLLAPTSRGVAVLVHGLNGHVGGGSNRCVSSRAETACG